MPCAAGAPLENAYIWAKFEPPIANNCSVVRFVGARNMFHSNYATLAGGAVYATDKASLDIRCSEGLPGDAVNGCSDSAWADNVAGALDKQASWSPALGQYAGVCFNHAHANQSTITNCIYRLVAMLAPFLC